MSSLSQRQVHLDFHTSEHIGNIGSMFDKKQFQDCLKKGHVNSITVFAKCHHGWAYFPSEKNKMHPGLTFDLLGAQLQACREIGVRAPVYLSAGFDEKYFFEHPDHGRIPMFGGEYKKIGKTADGAPFVDAEGVGYHTLCMNSPYLDVLVSQVEEVIEKYDPCEIFLDIVGEQFVCFCPYCRAQVIALGMDPENEESYRKLTKHTFKRYYTAINSAAKRLKPDIAVFHNNGHIPAGRRDFAHANTHHLELESLPTGGWGYDHFPRSAHYAAMLGMDYLGMTGKFHGGWGEFGGYKHPNALRYEVALSLALGARCSIGDQMHPYGFLDEATYELIGQAYAEAEAVEDYCYGITTHADIGLLSVESVIGEAKNHPADTGACRMLLEGKYLYDVIDTECDFFKYKVILLPDIVEVHDAELIAKLNGYVAGGGKILASGVSATDGEKFLFDFGAEYLGKNGCQPSYLHTAFNALGLPPTSYCMYSPLYDLTKAKEGARVLGHSRVTFFNRAREHFCSHQHTPFVPENHAPGIVIGKNGGYIAWEIFTEYAEKGSLILREAVTAVLDALLGEEKTLVTNLTSGGVVTLNEQAEKKRLVLHMLYAIPTKRGSGVEVIEDLPPVYGTTFAIRTEKPIRRVTAVPQNEEIPFTQKDGICAFTVDRFACKQVVTLEY